MSAKFVMRCVSSVVLMSAVAWIGCKAATQAPANTTAPSAVVSQEAKMGAIQKLLEITGTTDIAKQVIAQSIDQYRQMYPKVPDDQWSKLRGAVNENGLTERLAPLYEKHFSYDEIQGMLTFYETALGKKLLQSMPELMQATDQVSRQWGKELGNQIVDHLTKSGF